MPRHYRESPYVPARDPLRAIPPSRHPFQIWVLAALIISGAANFFTPGSEVLQEGLSPAVHKMWAAIIFASGLICIVSAWWHDRVMGLLLERTGMWTLGVVCPAYALLVYMQTGFSLGVPGVTLTALIGLAAIWRGIHANRELKILRRFMEAVY
jgi:hypothetical protein